MVDVGDQDLEAAAQQPAQKGHQALKPAEPQSGGEGMGQGDPPGGQPLAYRNGEGVHGQAHGQKEQFKNTHIRLSVLPFQAEILLPDVFCYPAEEGVQLCPLLGGKALFQRLEKGALIGLSIRHHRRGLRKKGEMDQLAVVRTADTQQIAFP